MNADKLIAVLESVGSEFVTERSYSIIGESLVARCDNTFGDGNEMCKLLVAAGWKKVAYINTGFQRKWVVTRRATKVEIACDLQHMRVRAGSARAAK